MSTLWFYNKGYKSLGVDIGLIRQSGQNSYQINLKTQNEKLRLYERE